MRAWLNTAGGVIVGVIVTLAGREMIAPAQASGVIYIPEGMTCVAYVGTPGPVVSATPAATLTPKPPTPTMVTGTPAVVITPITVPTVPPKCAFFGAEPAKGGSYRYTDPKDTGWQSQNVRSGPGTNYLISGQLPRGERRSVYWKVSRNDGLWVALDSQCQLWAASYLGEFLED